MAADPAVQSSGAPVETRLPAAGVADELSGTFASARATLSNFLTLLSLEARRAGLTLMWMVVLAGVASFCIVAAWLGLMAALVMWVVSLSFPPIAVVLAVAAINLIVGTLLVFVCNTMSKDLLFSATRRQVAGQSAVESPRP